MSDMLDLNNPLICTWCHNAMRLPNSAVCKECGELIEATSKMDPESATDRYPVDLFAKLSGRKANP